MVGRCPDRVGTLEFDLEPVPVNAALAVAVSVAVGFLGIGTWDSRLADTSAVAAAVAAGNISVLLDVEAADARFENVTCAGMFLVASA